MSIDVECPACGETFEAPPSLTEAHERAVSLLLVTAFLVGAIAGAAFGSCAG